MRILRSVAPILLILSLTACSGITPGAPERTLVVTGTGTVSLPPDLVIITLGVQSRNPDIGQAVGDNNSRMQQVMTAIRESGIAEEDIRTLAFNVSAQPKFDQFGNPTSEIDSYLVENVLEIRLRQLDRLGELLQTALSKGANSIQGVSFALEDPSQALQEARLKAMQDAVAQAQLLATEAGAGVGEIRSISEGLPSSTPIFQAPYGKGGGGGGVPSSPGSLEYQVQVMVEYTLR